MILEALVSAIAALVASIGDLFGSFEMPGWWDTIGPGLADLAGFAAGFGEWVPFGAAVNAVQFVVGAILLAFGIKVVRILVSLFTAGGGSAA